jgi:creatinine amidohydrolase
VIRPGCSSYHMDFGGSLNLSPSTLMNVIKDICFSLDRHGFANIILLPVHGGNFALVNVVTEEIAPKLKANLICIANGMLLFGTMQEAAAEKGIPRDAVGGHACAGETSIMLAYRPDLVHMDQAKVGLMGTVNNEYTRKGVRALCPTGVLGDPRPATKEAGEFMIEMITDRWMAAIKRELPDIGD